MSHKHDHTIFVTGKAHYAHLTHAVIDKIRSNEVGKIIIHGIRDSGKIVTVHRRSDADREDDVCNAETKAESREDAYTVGDSRTLFKNKPYDPDLPANKDQRFDHVARGFKGTGKGSDVVIRFDPEDPDDDCDRGTTAASDFDEVLLHELVHALRDAQGKVNYVPTQDHGYDNVEEFLAILVTNVYVSAKGGHRFRADHEDHRLLRHSLSTSAGFIHDIHNFRILKKYRRDWLETFAALARVKTHFNPFREMLHYSSDALSPMAHRSHELLFQPAAPSH